MFESRILNIYAKDCFRISPVFLIKELVDAFGKKDLCRFTSRHSTVDEY